MGGQAMKRVGSGGRCWEHPEEKFTFHEGNSADRRIINVRVENTIRCIYSAEGWARFAK